MAAACLCMLAASPVIAAPATEAPTPALAITFDDLPAHGPLPEGETRIDILQRIVAALRAAGAPPIYGFVNGVREEQEPASTPGLAAWRAAGFPLGNHTWSHMNLNDNPLPAFEADVLRNEPLLRELMAGKDWRWLRFPYLAEGDTPEKRAQVRRFLGDHGYRIAGVTMSFNDWAFNDPYARCVARHDEASIRALEQAYLKAAADEIVRARGMSKALYGRDIPYVLLMHVGALDARLAPQLLALYRAQGFRLITLPEAERDPFYANDLDLAAPPSPDTLEGAMAARGMQPPKSVTDLGWLAKVCTPASGA